MDATRTYLELGAPEQLRPALQRNPGLRVDRVARCPASFYRYLYTQVGGRHYWTDRLGWTDTDIRTHLDRVDISLWVMYEDGAPAGFAELRACEDGAIEIAYFGLLQEFQGRGLGAHLLSVAAQRAWDAGARRVWLHTSTLDHEAALPNYLKRGFTPYREERYRVTPPPPGA